MLRLAVAIVGLLAVSAAGAASQSGDVCGDAFAQAANPGGVEFCRGQARLTAADSQRPGSRERTAHLEGAANHFSRAARLALTADAKVQALDALVDVYDTPRLNDPARMELALRDVIAADPNRTEPMYRLARLLEDQGVFEAAEQTLLWARQQHPEDAEAYRMLARFYERRALALASGAAN